MKMIMLVASAAFIAWILFSFRIAERNEKAATNPPQGGVERKTFFVYAKISDDVLPIERGEKYEDPLNAMLHEKQIGKVTGGGTMMRKDKSIEYVGVDIELLNLDFALEAVREKLFELGAPKGSVLEFQRDGQEIAVSIHGDGTLAK